MIPTLALLTETFRTVPPSCPKGPPQDVVQVRFPDGRALIVPAVLSDGEVWIPSQTVPKTPGSRPPPPADVHPTPPIQPCILDGEAYSTLSEIASQSGRTLHYDSATVSIQVGAPLGVTSAEEPPPSPNAFHPETRLERSQITNPPPVTARAENVPASHLTGGGVLQTSFQASLTGQKLTTSIQGRLSAALRGGEITVTLPPLLQENGRITGNRTPNRARITYSRLLPSGPIRSLYIGTQISGLLRPITVSGLSLSTDPVLDPPTFSFQPHLDHLNLPPGTRYLVRLQDQILWNGILDPTERIPAIPVPPGARAINIEITLPDGTQRNERVSLITPSHIIPPGTVQLSARAGRCLDTALCRSAGSSSLEIGIHPWMSLQVGTEWREDTRSPNLLPFLGFHAFHPPTGWSVTTLAATDASIDTEILYSGLGTLSGSSLWFRNRSSSNETNRSLNTRIQHRTTSWLPSWSLLSSYTRTRTTDPNAPRTNTLQNSTQWSQRVEVGSPSRRIYAEYQHTSTNLQTTNFGLYTSLKTRTPTLPLLSLSTGAHQPSTGPARIYLDVTGSTRTHQVGLNVSSTAKGREPQLSLSFTGILGATRQGFRTHVNSTDPPTTEWNLDATLARDHAFHWRTISPLQSGGTGIQGRLYQDRNGNGNYDPEDSPVSDLTLWIDGRRVQTDAQGRYQTWGLSPYLPLLIRIDTTSLWSRQITSATGQTLLRPAPSSFTTLDFPLTQAREVIGNVSAVFSADVAGIPFLIKTSRLRHGPPISGTTYRDGGIYLPALPVGNYTLTLDPEVLQQRGFATAPVVFQVPAGSGPVQIPEIVLVPPTGSAHPEVHED